MPSGVCGLLALSGQSSLCPLPGTCGLATCRAHWDGLLSPARGMPRPHVSAGVSWRLDWPHRVSRKGAADRRAKPAALTVRVPPSMSCHSPSPSTAHRVWPAAPGKALEWSRALPPQPCSPGPWGVAPRLTTHSPGPLLLAQGPSTVRDSWSGRGPHGDTSARESWVPPHAGKGTVPSDPVSGQCQGWGRWGGGRSWPGRVPAACSALWERTGPRSHPQPPAPPGCLGRARPTPVGTCPEASGLQKTLFTGRVLR